MYYKVKVRWRGKLVLFFNTSAKRIPFWISLKKIKQTGRFEYKMSERMS